MAQRFRIYHYESLASTMSLAKELEQKVEGPFVVWASEQSLGYGRKGNKWLSPHGGLWFTAVFSSSRLDGLSAFLSLVLLEALKRMEPDLKIKWPNDIVFKKKKVAGMIIEVLSQVHWGVGINVNNTIPEEIAPRAASLREITGTSFELEEILNNLLSELSLQLPTFEKLGFAFFKKSYEENLTLLGRQVMVSSDGVERVGKVIGVDDRGFLLLKSANSILTIIDGEIIKF